MFTAMKRYCAAATALLLSGSFLIACTSKSTSQSAQEAGDFHLTLPDGAPPQEGWPLLIVAGEAETEEWEQVTPAVLLRVPGIPTTDEVAEAIFSARADHPIADTRVYGLSTSANSDALMENLHNEFPGMFAGIGLVEGQVSAEDSVGAPLQINVLEGEERTAVAQLITTQRSEIYNAAVLHPGISDERNSQDVRLATDGDASTFYQVDETGAITVGFDQPMVVHRWTLDFAEQPSRVTLEVTTDGDTWEKVDESDVSNDRLDRYVLSSDTVSVRLTATGGQIAEFAVHAQLANEARFSYEEYEGENISMPYRLYVPENSPSDLPVVLFLHGSGQRGSDGAQHLGATKGEGAVRWASDAEQAANPSIVIAPQIPADKLWRDPAVMEGLNGLVAEVVENYGGDPDRVYGTGLSIGAEGLLNTSILYPDLFAALLLVAGGPNNPVGGGPAVIDTVVPYAAQYAHIPIWEMQAFDDSVRPFGKTLEMVNALRAQGASPRLTAYLPGVTEKVATSTHSSWTLAYADTRIGSWLFSQNRRERPELGNPLPPIDRDVTGEALMELAGPGALYFEFD